MDMDSLTKKANVLPNKLKQDVSESAPKPLNPSAPVAQSTKPGHHPENQQDLHRFRNLLNALDKSILRRFLIEKTQQLREPFLALSHDKDIWDLRLDSWPGGGLRIHSELTGRNGLTRKGLSSPAAFPSSRCSACRSLQTVRNASGPWTAPCWTHNSSPSGLPLVLAALPDHHTLSHAVSHNPPLKRESIDISPEEHGSTEQLRQGAWSFMEHQYLQRLARRWIEAQGDSPGRGNPHAE
jgi:hypothetical protein